MVFGSILGLDMWMGGRKRRKAENGIFSDAAIGERLRLTREVLGLQQNEFAARANVSETAYNGYEKGSKRPSIENAIALCEAWTLTLDWIYRGDQSGLRYDTAEAIKAIRQARTRT
jgi:transcriptional regulator with XRE-family HTH domain